MRKSNIIIFQAISFFFIFVGIALFINPFDMWDGSIIEYASKTENFTGLKRWFFESGWFFQYYISIIIIKLSYIFNVPFIFMNAVLVMIFIFILLREIVFFASNELKMTNLAVAYASVLVATFSIWHVLFSSVLLMHLACFTLGILFVRWMHHEIEFKKLLGFLGLVIVFHLNSMLVFLPVLSYFYDFLNKRIVHFKGFIYPSRVTIVIFLYALAYFLLFKILIQPYGIYEGYNELIITSFSGLIRMLVSAFFLSTYLMPAFLVSGLIFFAFLLSHQSTVGLITKETSHDLLIALGLLILFSAALFPYAAVGKYSSIWSIGNWNGRYAIPIVFPASLFTSFCLQYLYDKFSSELLKNFVLGGGVLILLLQLTFLSAGVLQKLNRQIFLTHLESLIHANEDKLPPGLLEIVGNDIPTPEFKSYESNFIMFEATGKANWFSRIAASKDKGFAIPCFIKSDRDFQVKYIYSYLPEHDKNHTILEINTIGFSGYMNALRNVLSNHPPGQIEIEKIHPKHLDSNEIIKSCN